LAYVSAAAVILASGLLLGAVPVVSARAAAPIFLFAVLVVALRWGTGPALFASFTAAFAYSYFFLPPVGLAIETPDDWVALGTFTATAVLVGELAARAERRHVEALEGRLEIEALYQKLESAFDRASEAEAARRNEQLKAALLDALRHNLRTPLTAIKASVTALLGSSRWNERAALSQEEFLDLLQVIDEETDRLNGFIGGLATADRVAGGAADGGARSASLDEILTAGLARAEAITRDHRVTLSVEEGIPPLAVDAAALVEVVYILLDNATKYSPAGSEVRISASLEGHSHVYIEVADEGPGIPPLLRERVFENFFRIEGREPTDPHRTGLGLGLPIARRLVEAQTGRIWIESPPSRSGTAVIMMLPLCTAQAEEETAAAAPAAS
jgi:two-component system sensor histidine kinase KdpD